MACSSRLSTLRRRIPFFPIIPLVPLTLLVAEAVATIVLFRRVRSLEARAR
jgi:hypothetical protein